MRIRRIPSLLTVSATILTAGLLIAASLETPPNRSSNVKAAPQNTKPSRAAFPVLNHHPDSRPHSLSSD